MKKKGLIKVFNEKKFKTVSYKNEDRCIIFRTNCKSNKYNEFTKTGKIKLKHNNKYDVTLIEDKESVDKIFYEFKKEKIVPFFISRKDKIVVKFYI